jgi:hypothetical protein
MPANFVLLERIELNASAASVTFANIPQTGYTDLKVVVSARNTSTDGAVKISFNGNSSTGTYRFLQGSGAAASSSNGSAFGYVGNETMSSDTASTFGSFDIYIPNAFGTTQKSISIDNVTENNATTAYATMLATLVNLTSAITSVKLEPSANSFAQYSTFSLYGLAALGTTPAIAPKATGGNVIATDGTYWYHAFLSSGTFTPATSLSCDILQVAGGGGGSFGVGGGGGAGGLIAYASQSVSGSNTVTIGAGGASGTTNGNSSSFAALTASVGGGYGGENANGNTGGSGGGAGGTNSYTGGTATSGQGSNGGSTSGGGGLNGGGGGGGKGAAGGANSTLNGGTGGIGVNTVTNWGSFADLVSAAGVGASGYFAGGGGGGSRDYANNNGGTGGTGGGGKGAGANGVSVVGTINTGGGGGGGSNDGTRRGAAGGSGIIIVRYLA